MSCLSAFLPISLLFPPFQRHSQHILYLPVMGSPDSRLQTCSLARERPGTPGIFSILETFKRHKRQTATERDKCTLLI
jgi:hypothetical protein